MIVYRSVVEQYNDEINIQLTEYKKACTIFPFMFQLNRKRKCSFYLKKQLCIL